MTLDPEAKIARLAAALDDLRGSNRFLQEQLDNARDEVRRLAAENRRLREQGATGR